MAIRTVNADVHSMELGFFLFIETDYVQLAFVNVYSTNTDFKNLPSLHTFSRNQRRRKREEKPEL